MKNILDNSIPEQDRIEYYFKEDNKFFITEKGYKWFKDNCGSSSNNSNSKKNNIESSSNNSLIYKDLICFYKQRVEFLENENKRLLDIIAFKEQKEVAKDVKNLDDGKENKKSIFDFFKLFGRD